MKRTAQERANTSKGRIAAFKRDLSLRVAEPDLKRCSCCGKTKYLSEFSNERETLKSGLISIRPASQCKKCRAEKSAARRKVLRAEGVDLAAKQRKYNKNRNREKARAYAREWAMNRRREEGKPARGPWKKYRDDRPERRMLPTAPITAFLLAELGHKVEEGDIARLVERTGVSPRRLWGVINGEHKSVSLSNIDKILSGLGCPEQMPILYPDLTVGYHIVTPEELKALTNH